MEYFSSALYTRETVIGDFEQSYTFWKRNGKRTKSARKLLRTLFYVSCAFHGETGALVPMKLFSMFYLKVFSG